MKQLLLLLTVTAMVFAGAVTAKSDEGKKDGVLIHISQGPDSPQRVLMALKMAEMMADNHDVLVYFDIDAVKVALADSKDLTFPHFDSSKALLDALRAKNVLLMACEGCLQIAGKTEKDLAPGIKLADKERFFSFTKGRILTLDY